MPRKLTPVGPDEVPKPQRKKTLIEAAESGDDVALCMALRTRLVEAINDTGTPRHALAALSRQVSLLTEQLDRLEQKRQNGIEAALAAPVDERWDGGAI
jgi:hypothetical protein